MALFMFKKFYCKQPTSTRKVTPWFDQDDSQVRGEKVQTANPRDESTL